MRNILIVEALSTGCYLVNDVRRRGYNPVILECPGEPIEGIRIRREETYALFDERPEIIRALDDYSDTLDMVKELDPLLVLAAWEPAITLATRLAEDLGLAGNSVKNLDAMTKKDGMQEALKKAGIRYIKSKVVRSADEAVFFCRENGLKEAVVKPIESSGSFDLFMCDDVDDVVHAVNTVLSDRDIFDRPIEKALVQERIIGTEYIVNTASCKGKHILNSMLRYSKVKTAEGRYIYDYAESINSLEQGHTGLVEYAFRTADAIGFQYGVIHGEYMLDEKGPVLIEVNCRPMGGDMEDLFLDSIFGQHETDTMLDAYLDPEGFFLKAKKEYHPLRKGVIKIIMVTDDMEVEDHSIWVIAKQLKSVYKIMVNKSSTPVFYQKTGDLGTAGGTLFLVHDDENVVMSDLKIIKEIENNYFSLFFNDGMSRRWFEKSGIPFPDFDALIKECGCHGAVLVACDKEWHRDGIQVVTAQTLEEARTGFDHVIIGYQSALLAMKESECLELLFKTMDKVKEGGRVIIPQCTYDYLTYKKEGAELLMRIKGLAIQAPKMDLYGYVIGIKEG